MMNNERNEEMKGLVKDLSELKDAMGDISILINEQGENLNKIDTQATDADIYVEEGVRDMKTSLDYQNSYRKKMCFIIVIVAIVLITVGIIVYFVIIGKDKHNNPTPSPSPSPSPTPTPTSFF